MGDVKIGLEIHGYLNMENKRKLFCNCKIDSNAKPNTNICPTCTSQPGSKPMLPNNDAVEKIISIGLMLGCKINNLLIFQRKHYSWPDLPSGYQRTMSGSFGMPVGLNGEFLGIGIEEIHLEEDPARWDPISGKVDYNRSGFPLVEIVTKPDFKSTSEVQTWLKTLLTTLSYIRAVDKTAGIKCDVNVSIAPNFIRTEVKNVNSISSILKAINFEVERQKKEKNNFQQTRAWDDSIGETLFMRSKESAQDYMFIPEPDLPVINIDPLLVKKIALMIPEKPSEKFMRYKKMGVDKTDAKTISSEIVLAELFEEVVKKINPVFASKWFRRDVIAAINNLGMDYDDLKVDVSNLVDWFELLQDKKASPVVLKELLPKLLKENLNIKQYIEEQGLESLSDMDELESFCKEAILAKKEAVLDFKSGNEKAINSIIGFVMAKTQGKADPNKVNSIIKKLIK
ncbi:MAG: Asp-tRNA(Asn)/Glu-tRNA(Gln) amidotransferase subunit GatB [Nanoarchaeota archaeon]|nr:Asp-tRNA(Asn)/Glu-tRNA(Gln) amidotransferase subunit GatB [Nanoarchaeota archaeon]MBU1030398.1 Asp-tRNA(Asn)/Glu-tRNA(Gln) amidotransferase subunit GatB [Nanoarchaeota archaeon]MBU1850020.1 Asp-tRNA(Asn)/Glu-tRNA(Gln) amidotransferase subunit GatB [Nanoarchaeota archaeon]